MIGMMIGRAVLRGAAGATSKGATPPKDVKPTPCHPAAIAIAVGLFLVIVIASLAGGGQVVGWITPVACIMGLVLLGGMFFSGAGEAKATARKIEDIPGSPNPPVPSAAELNAYYETLRQRPERDEPPTFLGVPLSEIKKGTYKTVAQLRAEDDAEIRHNRVTDILKAECPVCTTHAGGFCTFHPGQRVVKLDEGIIIHSERLSAALKTGVANLRDVKAQFNGTIPEDIMADAL